ncbi:MAG TPA: hypothetical protein VFD31_06565 [Thermoleophilaceae bacterium]|nr:hypothetical protein [Thermoleophilaceae bacterium]
MSDRPAWSFAAVAVAATLVAGCGGDDEPAPRDSGRAETEKAPEGSTTETEPKDAKGSEGGGAEAPPPGEQDPAAPPGGGSPEDQPGGAGDEIPARSQALITGRDGRLSPRRVRVPPFISVRVELRSADGAEYTLAGGGKRITAGGRVEAMTADFDGLRPGRRLVLTGPAGKVIVEASAEPGP